MRSIEWGSLPYSKKPFGMTGIYGQKRFQYYKYYVNDAKMRCGIVSGPFGSPPHRSPRSGTSSLGFGKAAHSARSVALASEIAFAPGNGMPMTLQFRRENGSTLEQSSREGESGKGLERVENADGLRNGISPCASSLIATRDAFMDTNTLGQTASSRRAASERRTKEDTRTAYTGPDSYQKKDVESVAKEDLVEDGTNKREQVEGIESSRSRNDGVKIGKGKRNETGLSHRFMDVDGQVEIKSSRRPRLKKKNRKLIPARYNDGETLNVSRSRRQDSTFVSPKSFETDTEFQKDIEFLESIHAHLDKSRRKLSRRSRKTSQQDIFADSVAFFLSNISNTPLLKAKQEQTLGRIIVRGLKVRAAGEELARKTGHRPSMEEVATAAGMPSADVAARAIMLGDEATELMVFFNLRMVFNIANKAYRSLSPTDVELSDLIAEGTLGLRRAIQTWDPFRKLKFSTYGHWWIRQAVYRYSSSHRMAVRLPYTLEELGWKINKTADKLSSEPGRTEPPSNAEIAAELGVSVEKVRLVRKYNQSITGGAVPSDIASLNTEDNVGAPEDVLIDENDPVGEAEREEHIRTLLSLMLCMLPTRERNVLRLKYELNSNASVHPDSNKYCSVKDANGNTSYDLQAISSAYSLCRERIRQLERIALARLQVPWRQALARMLESGIPLTYENVDNLLSKLNERAGGSDNPIDEKELAMVLSTTMHPPYRTLDEET